MSVLKDRRIGVTALLAAGFCCVMPDRLPDVEAQTTAAQKAPFEVRFWDYLTKAPKRYDEWGPFAGKPDDGYEGREPHGAWLRVYANRVARRNPKRLPYGSIIIKENYGPDKKTLAAITVMYRSKGYDPAHNNWYFVKFLSNGDVARTSADEGSRRIAGRRNTAKCIECHSSADGEDFVFLNDRLK